MPAPPNFNSLAAATFQNVNSEVTDNIYNAFPMLTKMKAEGGFATRTGGKRIDVNIRWQTDNTAGGGAQSFSGYDQINVQPVETATNAYAPWKDIAVAVVISEDEIAQNRGKTMIFDLLKEKKEGAELDGQRFLTAAMLSDGTGNSGKDPMGLSGIININPATGTLQNINSATYTWWRNKYNASIDSGITGSALTATSTISAAAYFNAVVSNQRNNCSRGSQMKKDRPNLGLTTQVNFERYKNSLLDRVRYDKGSEPNHLGVDEYVMFEGMPIIWDPGLTTETIGSTANTSRMYLINTNYLQLIVNEGYDFKIFPQQSPVDQFAYVTKMMWQGNLVVKDRSRQGIISGFLTQS